MRPPTRRTRSAASTRAFSLGLIERPTSPAKLSCSPSNVLERRKEPVTGKSKRSANRAKAALARLVHPPSAKNGDRPFGRPQHLLQFGHLRKARPDRDPLGARRVRHGRHFRQHVLGQRDHDRARPALHRNVKRALDNLRDLRRGLDLRRELCRRGEKRPIVHLLEGAPPHHRPLDLADEQDHRRRIVLGDMQPMRGVGRAGAAGDEADSWPPGQAPFGQRHHRRARLLPADGQFDRRVVHGVEGGEVGFAGNAIDPLDPLRDELVDENLSARSQSLAQRRCSLPITFAGNVWQFTPFISIAGQKSASPCA